MISDSTLDLAVTRGHITAEQAARLRDLESAVGDAAPNSPMTRSFGSLRVSPIL